MRAVLQPLGVLLLVGSLVSACLRPPASPMRVRALSEPDRVPAPTLIVLLPGRYDSAADFARHDFPALARAAGVDADLLAVDGGLG